MPCVLDTNLVAYLVVLVLPTLLVLAELSWLRFSSTVPLTVTQRNALEIAGVFCATGLLVAVPIHSLLLADCL